MVLQRRPCPLANHATNGPFWVNPPIVVPGRGVRVLGVAPAAGAAAATSETAAASSTRIACTVSSPVLGGRLGRPDRVVPWFSLERRTPPGRPATPRRPGPEVRQGRPDV